jgi:hypothetical protein
MREKLGEPGLAHERPPGAKHAGDLSEGPDRFGDVVAGPEVEDGVERLVVERQGTNVRLAHQRADTPFAQAVLRRQDQPLVDVDPHEERGPAEAGECLEPDAATAAHLQDPLPGWRPQPPHQQRQLQGSLKGVAPSHVREGTVAFTVRPHRRY